MTLGAAATRRAFFSMVTALWGCASSRERIIVTADRSRPSASEIDADPWALLPQGAVLWGRLDRSIFDSAFSGELKELLDRRLPIPRSARLRAERDLVTIVGGAYATVGNDFVAICQGQFDAADLAQAFQVDPVTRAGRPLVSGRFAGVDMYVSDTLALCMLSSRTLVTGTQLGVRRVLELVEERRMKRRLPDWFERLLVESSGDFHIGVDLDAQPVPAVFHTELEFMNHMRAARVIGNFAAPGLNFAGSLSFAEPHSAEQATSTVNGLAKKLEQYEVLLKMLKVPRPIHKLQAAQTGTDTQVVAELSAKGVVGIMDKSQEIFGEVELSQWLAN